MWRLTQPNGDVLEFGGTEDSRIQAVGRGGAIREWALSKYTDTAGNYYTVSYFEDTAGGGYRPTAVIYNQGNARSRHYSVEFSYEPRPDRVEDYAQSARVNEYWRLKWIAVKSGGQLIRKYRLDYEAGPATNHSRLIQVQEYGRDGVSTLPPETFAYEARRILGEPRSAGRTHRGAGFPPNTGAGNSQWFTGDFNGDGEARRREGRGTSTMSIYADVHVSTAQASRDQRWANAQGDWISTNTAAGNSQWFTGDFNGDGKTDLAKVWNDSTG